MRVVFIRIQLNDIMTAACKASDVFDPSEDLDARKGMFNIDLSAFGIVPTEIHVVFFCILSLS